MSQFKKLITINFNSYLSSCNKIAYINRFSSNYTKHIFFEKFKMSETTVNETSEIERSKSEIKHKTKLELKEERKANLKIRRKAKKEAKAVGFSGESLNQTSYYFENGLRKVYPYYFGWNTTAKERWFGRTLVDIYSSEFCRAIMNQSIENLIETGKIRVNGQIKPLNYLIKNGDRISHTKHRHEIPVLDDEIKFIYEDEDYLVVDKPCSIPMHPCGKYRYNSLGIILTKEYGYANLRTMYRLDRLTSGLVVSGKNFKSCLVIDKHIKERTAQKTYLSRVVGEFPEGRIVVKKAIDCASRKIGLYWIDEQKGKESVTEFERVSYNGKSSVVKCFPKTGRTHQIRIHLQYLGYPIVNDPLYNQPTVWGKTNGKDGVYEYTKEQIEQNFLNVHTYEAWIIKQEQLDNPNNTNEEDDDTGKKNIIEKPISSINDDETKNGLEKQNLDEENFKRKNELKEEPLRLENTEKIENVSKKQKIEKEKISEKYENKKNRPGFDECLVTKEDECFECKQKYRDPKRSDLTMYLHALSYKFDDIEFKTEIPKWAEPDFEEPVEEN